MGHVPHWQIVFSIEMSRTPGVFETKRAAKSLLPAEDVSARKLDLEGIFRGLIEF